MRGLDTYVSSAEQLPPTLLANLYYAKIRQTAALQATQIAGCDRHNPPVKLAYADESGPVSARRYPLLS
jgi:hypothetical protein